MTIHCKPLNHLRLALSTAPAQPRPLVTYEAAMPCLAGATPGIVLSKDGKALDGLHLLPESCVGLPPELRTYAAEAGARSVSLSHPIRRLFEVWDDWNAVDTAWLADEIDRVWATRPPTTA